MSNTNAIRTPLTAEQKAFMKSFKDTHDQYEIPDDVLESFLRGGDSYFNSYFDGYTQLADAYNIWSDAMTFARKNQTKTYRVRVLYDAYHTFEVEAESANEAQDKALDQARMIDVPEDYLHTSVADVEEVES